MNDPPSAKVIPLRSRKPRGQGHERRGEILAAAKAMFLAGGYEAFTFDVTDRAATRAACDRLVVGLNSDASVRRLKGEGRPLQDQDARAAVLSALEAVDLVAVFDEDTPLALIRQVRPKVLVKGADYRADQVVGREVVEADGGEVVLVGVLPGYSTTRLIGRGRE